MCRDRYRWAAQGASPLAIALALVAFAGCSLATASSPRPTTSPTHFPTVLPTLTLAPSALPPAVTGTLGPPPSHCVIALPPQTMTTPDFGGGFSGTTTFDGASPAWELGIGTDGTMPLYEAGNPYPSAKIMWVVGPNYAQPVTLSGHEVTSGTPLWFDIYPNNRTGGQDWYGRAAVLDPAAPNRGYTNNSTGHWNIWGIGIIATVAGCYELDVTSSVGSWHSVLAVGASG